MKKEKKEKKDEVDLLEWILSDGYTGSSSNDDGDDNRAADRLERPYDDDLER